MDARWLAGLEEDARSALVPELFEYVAQGARDSTSAREAGAAWAAVRLLPRVLQDVTRVELACSVLGTRFAVPWGIAPTTLRHAVHPDGELAMARAAAAAGSLLVVSSNTGTAFSDVAATGARWWVQVYLPADRSLARPMLEAAVRAGAEAIVLTVDTPVVGTKYAARERVVWDTVDPATLRANFAAGYVTDPGAAKAQDLAPEDIAALRHATGLPVVVKGVLRADDARRCVEAGAAAIWVSNHGGRQLDRTATTASCLPEVVDAVGDVLPVYVDGGLRSGLDVLTALALGADAVFLGRLPLWALVSGESGVARMHAELTVQLGEALRLAGCARLADARGLAQRRHLPPR